MKNRVFPIFCQFFFSIALADPLPPMPQADISKITVSGLSAGGAMAQQVGVSYSDRIAGIGAIAGPPYLCAQLGIFFAGYKCSQFGDRFLEQNSVLVHSITGDPANPNVEGWIRDTRRFASDGWIAPVSNIRQQRVWLVRGSEDDIGPGPRTFEATGRFFRHFGAQVFQQTRPNMHHTMPTARADLKSCGVKADPDYLSSCGYSAAEEMLSYLNPGLPASGQGGGKLVSFDQQHYTVKVRSEGAGETTPVEPWEIGMAEKGWAYIPEACRNGSRCKVHVALHGCAQGDDVVSSHNGHRFVREAGYNDWAARHNMIVLYPQTDIETRQYQLWENEHGCWDWWGETSPGPQRLGKYATRRGDQVRSIMNMVDALALH